MYLSAKTAIVLTCVVALAVALLTVFGAPARAATGGPVVLMGIDAEDGGPGGHGPNSIYQDVVNNTLSQATNGGSGILVVGGGKDPSDNVTQFWNAIDAGTTECYLRERGCGYRNPVVLWLQDDRRC